MRTRVPAVLAGLALLGTACSGGGGGPGPISAGGEAVCTLLDRLSATAEPLLTAGVEDPEAFHAALDLAVIDFVSTLDSLAETVPDELADDVEALRGLVEQYRFQEAFEARAPIDEYALRVCDDAAA